MTLRLRAPDTSSLASILDRATGATYTYAHVGSTLGAPGAGRHGRRTHSRVVGHGEAGFVAARDALRTWAPQRSIGITVEPAGQLVEAGATVVLVIRRGPFHVVVPNRVVTVIDEPRRFAYAYGTLPDHDESGEECFEVEHLAEGSVRATVRVDAVAASALARCAAPVVRLLSTAALLAYLRGIERQVARTVA